jgi:hypothetical protein
VNRIFSETIELKPSVLKLDQTLMNPARIHLYGNFLFLKHIRTAYLYEVYDLNTNKKINECMSRGQGPGEMISPNIIDIKNRGCPKSVNSVRNGMPSAIRTPRGVECE